MNQGIKALGFHQSATNPCLYLCNDCIIIFYTDDTLILAKDDTTINSVRASLSTTFTLEDQGSVNDFLGIQIRKDIASRTIDMTQPGLIDDIDSIINDVGFNHTTITKHTPTGSILHIDKSNTTRDDKWNYISIIGKLSFLAQNTRPDISFTVHQCARFCTAPTRLHEIAMKCIIRYLLLTKTEGLILHTTKNFQL